MKSNYLIQLLQALDKDEFRRLNKFLQSPYFNSNPLIVKLYEALKPYYPGFDSPKLTKEKIYAKLFPGERPNEARLRNLISDLKLLTEEYLTDLELRQNDFEKKKVLNKAYGRRNLFPFFEKETTALLGELDKLPYKDIHVYNEEMWLKHDYFFHPLTDKYKSPAFEIQGVMEDLDHFFVLAKLQFGGEMKNRERIFSIKYPIRLLEESVVEANNFQDNNPVFNLYINIYALNDVEKNEQAYANGKKLLNQYYEKISTDDKINILLNLRNYIIQKINSGSDSHFKELLELYKLGLKLHIIIDNNKMKEADFTNIVNAGCMQKEFDWTERFINNYEKYLDKSVREDAKILGLAILYFHSKNYDEAMSRLGQHVFVHPLYQITTKNFLIRLWFEQFYVDNDYYDFLLAQLDAFDKFIRRNNAISSIKKEENLNFILAAKKTAGYIYHRKSAQEIKEKMKFFLNGEKRIVAKRWFEEKLSQLK